MKVKETKSQIHSIPPVWDENSRILILGSFPSVKSRETSFFYGHPQNRFWRVLAELLCEAMPVTIEDKKTLLLKNNIALWDVIASCEMEGSSDSSIKNVMPNDITEMLKRSKIKTVFLNGTTAAKLYGKYIFPSTKIKGVSLPSTSPANASWTFERLLEAWRVILTELNGESYV